MVYSPNPPYEILQNKLLDFPTMQRLRRFARYWDLIANSGNFIDTTPFLWGGPHADSPFHGFLAFADWLHAKAGQTHGIALHRLAEFLLEFLVSQRHMNRSDALAPLRSDYARLGRLDLPEFMRDPDADAKPRARTAAKRQARHLTP
jgi:hypothetical protein